MQVRDNGKATLGVGTVADVGLAITGHGSARDLSGDAMGLLTLGLDKAASFGLVRVGTEEATRKIADLVTAGAWSHPGVVFPFLPDSQSDAPRVQPKES